MVRGSTSKSSDTSSQSSPSTPQTTASKENTPASLGSILTSTLDVLKIENTQIRIKAVEFVGRVPQGTVNIYGKWITVVKAIADACAVNPHTFSQSEVCDFLTVAANGIEAKSKTTSDATFQVYRDIMENYHEANEELKLNYPRIIVDVISILDKGIDTKGQKIGTYNISRYYQERKTSVIQEDPSASYSSKPFEEKKGLTRTELVENLYDEELVNNLCEITGRSKKQLEKSISELPVADIKKIKDLSMNYAKLQKYGKLSKSSEFKKEVEKDLGRKLTDNQLQHAVNSIRKAKTYIENVLDGKFVPHGTHGINHVKHNLEYGYQLMGLMQPRKRRA